MTSLGLLQYSEISDNSSRNDIDKRKQSRHNITIKKRPNADGNSDNVQNMLKLINNSNGYDNDGGDDSGLVDFNPPPHAEISSKDSTLIANDIMNKVPESKVSVDYEKPVTIVQSNDLQKRNEEAAFANRVTAAGPRQYPAPMDSYESFVDVPKNYATNFYKQYVPYFNQGEQQPSFAGGNKDQLIEKLNYMIFLLEEQKDEKTGHVMEEVILYSFLGVFIIFIIDSFARAGKYTR